VLPNGTIGTIALRCLLELGAEAHCVQPTYEPPAEQILPIGERLAVDDRYAGRGVTAAFIDAGFYAHPDLTTPKQRIRAYYDILHVRSGVELLEKPDVSSWHGMMTTVVAAGNGHLSEGRYRSLASEMQLVLIKAGETSRVRHDDIAASIDWVISHRERLGIRILNISCGGDYEASHLTDRLSQRAEEAIRAGIVVVAAVGNSGHDPNHRVLPPASVPAVISVGGSNDHGDPRKGQVSRYWSSYGPTIDGLQKPEIIAPAIWLAAPILPGTPTKDEAELLSLLDETEDEELQARLIAHPGISKELDAAKELQPYLLRELVSARLRDQKVISGHYKHVDGTSFAAPIVTSIVAQMLEANPHLSPLEVKKILIQSAERLPDVPVDRQGWGVVQPAAAVTEAARRR
jgi:serine protease AprX